MENAFWIWYPGDFEIYHGLLQNLSREERGFDWPAYWQLDDCRKHVRYQRSYELAEETSFTVYSHAQGYLRVNDAKKRFGEAVVCGPGPVKIEVFAAAVTGVPAVLIEGEIIHSGAGWEADDFVSAPVPVGYSGLYREKAQNPSRWEYAEAWVTPETVTEMDGGLLLDFGRELNAELKLSFKDGISEAMVCYGESREEALDVENCYYSERHASAGELLRRRAFRYVYLPDIARGSVEVNARHLFTERPVRAHFSCADAELNRIWEVSAETFRLCSDVFFIDGIKRDRWIWSGDAYQSYFVNRYLLFDEEISKRTIWALRGNDPVRQHINTIVDYSMYWLLSISDYYEMTGDLEFLRQIWPKMVSMVEFLEGQLDAEGFLVGRPGDWIFLDWAELDKNGPLCAEQILLAACLEKTGETGLLLGEDGEFCEKCRRQAAELREKIDRFFWSEEKQAYVDSFTSGRAHVSRHCNIFAILYGQADTARVQSIYEHVLSNDAVPQITTPYFKFFEYEALCRLGKRREVLQKLKAYWGGMISEGAVTCWEEYDPQKSGREHYEMYGDPYGKSLCHAWGANPIYMIGRHFMGLRPTAAAYTTFEVSPDTTLFGEFSCELPVKDGSVWISWDGAELRVKTDHDGGSLIWNGQTCRLQPGKECICRKS